MVSRLAALLGAAALCVVGCAPRPDPRVQAAEDFRSTVFGLIGEDEAQTKRLNSLRMGMSDQDVIATAGPPTQRETRTDDDGKKVETWTYNGQLSTLGTLTFEGGKLSDVKTY